MSRYFEHSRDDTLDQNPDDDSELLEWVGYRSIISRLTTAAAASAEILPLQMPAINSTYEIKFYGPYVECEEANETIAKVIEKTSIDNAPVHGNATQTYNGFFAYSPDLTPEAEAFGQPSRRDLNTSRGSNELWMSFKRNGTEVTKGAAVAYPSKELNGKNPQDLVDMSYSSYFLAFAELLTSSTGFGSMGFYQENITDPLATNFTQIDSAIANTALLGSSDTYCFFAFSWFFNNVTWAPWSQQRELDIKVARDGAEFDLLLPELSVNLTISLMNNALLTTLVDTNVTIYDMVGVYDYRVLHLILPYSVALLAAAIANLLGFIAFKRNKIRMDKSFSFTAGATQHTHLVDERYYNRRGSVPAPRDIMDTKVQFLELEDGGGMGFQIVDKSA
ncbi:hypothetical protein ABW19_dt0203384 [Dactylella cylindrospora]|nr:hypothetical protein ABW19_dt0203384 [Dactylella cylindrospora]